MENPHKSELGDVHAVTTTLARDVEALVVQRRFKDDQRTRRNLVRAFMALVEGSCFSMKRVLLTLDSVNKITLSEDQRMLLREQSIAIRENGTVERTNAKITFKQNIRFVVKLYVDLFGGKHHEMFGHANWARIVDLNGIRGKLMHPKSSADLEIDDKDVEVIEGLLLWYLKSMTQLLDGAVAMLSTTTTPASS